MYTNGTLIEIKIDSAEYEKVLSHHRSTLYEPTFYVGTNQDGQPFYLRLNLSVISIQFRGNTRMDSQIERPLCVEITHAEGEKVVLLASKKEYNDLSECLRPAEDMVFTYGHDFFGNAYFVLLGRSVLSLNATDEKPE